MVSVHKTEDALNKIPAEGLFTRENFVTREEWKAVKPTIKKRIKHPVPYVVFTYSNSIPCKSRADCTYRVKGIQMCNMDNCALTDIRFHFLIGGDGRIYEGRGWTFTGKKLDETERLHALTGKYIEIAFICRDDEEPTKEMGEAAATVVREGINKGFLAKDVKATTIWRRFTIPKAVTDIENLRVSRHIVKNVNV